MKSGVRCLPMPPLIEPDDIGPDEPTALPAVDRKALDIAFTKARTHKAWHDRPVSVSTLQAIYETARLGPTSLNCAPQRIVFLASQAAKQRLMPALDEGNRQKSMSAPVVAIFAYDTRFYEFMPKLAPHLDAREWTALPAEALKRAAFRNATLQAAYFMIAARMHGVDCGPMSGFDNEMVDREFLTKGRWHSNFLCNLGHGDPLRLRPRAARLDFDEACLVL